MTSKSGVTICPNPKCHREIEEPILLNNLSKTPAEQYYACPHCLIKLDMDAEKEEEVIKEPIKETAPSPPTTPSLEKVLDVIAARPQKEKREDREEASPVKPPKEEEKGPERKESAKECPYNFGYLSHRPKDASIPQECLTCNRIVECMLKV